MKRRVPFSVWVGLSIAILLDTIVEYAWKSATRGIPDSASVMQTLYQSASEPLFHLAVLLWIAQFLNWMLVLSKSDLSFAQPVTSLSLVTVAIVAKLAIGESIPTTRWVGILLIVVGVWQISLAGHKTNSAVAPVPTEVSG